MADRTLQPGFALLPAVATVTAVAALAGALAWAVVPAVSDGHAAVTQTVGLMAALGWATALVSLLPVALLGSLGVMATVGGWFVGTAARVAITLGVAVVLVRRLGLPADAATWSLMIVYLALLFTETGLVGRYLWMKDSLPREGSIPAGAGGALA